MIYFWLFFIWKFSMAGSIFKMYASLCPVSCWLFSCILRPVGWPPIGCFPVFCAWPVGSNWLFSCIRSPIGCFPAFCICSAPVGSFLVSLRLVGWLQPGVSLHFASGRLAPVGSFLAPLLPFSCWLSGRLAPVGCFPAFCLRSAGSSWLFSCIPAAGLLLVVFPHSAFGRLAPSGCFLHSASVRLAPVGSFPT